MILILGNSFFTSSESSSPSMNGIRISVIRMSGCAFFIMGYASSPSLASPANIRPSFSHGMLFLIPLRMTTSSSTRNTFIITPARPSYAIQSCTTHFPAIRSVKSNCLLLLSIEYKQANFKIFPFCLKNRAKKTGTDPSSGTKPSSPVNQPANAGPAAVICFSCLSTPWRHPWQPCTPLSGPGN